MLRLAANGRDRVSASASPARAERQGPSFLYRFTGLLNAALWRTPLPRRLIVRLGMIVYRNPPMPAELVLTVAERLRAAGVQFWLSGGWGVDALRGACTRTHRDLDLVVEDGDLERAVAVVRSLGFWEWYRSDVGVPLESRVVFHDHELAGRVIDLHPLRVADGVAEFDTGTVAGRPVPCLSLDTQLQTHANYKLRGHDRADIAVLQDLAGHQSARPAPQFGRRLPAREIG
jgi:lincosamide nucleotidyltransferase A/C/D/E